MSSDSAATIADVSDGKAWAAIELVRSVCLQGNLRVFSVARSSVHTM